MNLAIEKSSYLTSLLDFKAYFYTKFANSFIDYLKIFNLEISKNRKIQKNQPHCCSRINFPLNVYNILSQKH
jgi:hypothetical protein